MTTTKLSTNLPEPPEKPLPTDCCETGCEVCIFDAYADALREYEKQMQKWENADTKPSVR